MDIKKCSTKELVNLLNKGLAKGLSGAKICKDNNLARSSVLTRLKREGYIHDKEANQYIKNDTEENTKKSTKKVAKKPNKKKIVKEEVPAIEEILIEEEVEDEENGNSLEEVEKKISKLREALQNGKRAKKKPEQEEPVQKEVVQEEVKVIKEVVAISNQDGDIKELKNMLEALNSRIENLENKPNESSIVTIQNTKETTTRSIRLYKEVNNKLNEYIKTNKEKKVIDVLSLAILEYINKK